MNQIEFKGKKFYVVEGSTHPMYSLHTFTQEEKELRDKYWNVKEGDVVIDVGASYGSYALTACAMGATVYAYEPEPSVYVDLLRNVNLNTWQKRCTPIKMALSDKKGTVDMKEYAPHWPTQTITADYPTTTLDDEVLLLKIEKVDWIKIDVEGLEEKVIEGAKNTVHVYKPKVLIECHDFMDPGISARVKAMLPGYKFEEIEREPCITLLGVHQ